MINENQKLGLYQLTFTNPVTETPSTLIAMYNSEGRWTELLKDEVIAPNDLVALGSRGENGWAPTRSKRRSWT